MSFLFAADDNDDNYDGRSVFAVHSHTRIYANTCAYTQHRAQHTHAIMWKLWKLDEEITPEYTQFYLSLFGSVSIRFDCLFVSNFICDLWLCVLGAVVWTEWRTMATYSVHIRTSHVHVHGTPIQRTTNWTFGLRFELKSQYIRFYYLNYEICNRILAKSFRPYKVPFRKQLGQRRTRIIKNIYWILQHYCRC